MKLFFPLPPLPFPLTWPAHVSGFSFAFSKKTKQNKTKNSKQNKTKQNPLVKTSSSALDKRELFAAFAVSVLISRQSKPSLIYLQSSLPALEPGWEGSGFQLPALFVDSLISHKAISTCVSVVFSVHARPFLLPCHCLPNGC